MPQAHVVHLGTVPYEPTAELQRLLRSARVDGRIVDTLLVLEHEPVVTRGNRTEDAEVALVHQRGVPVVETERGGKATYHGPGQIVIYPIFDLDQHGGDVKQLVCKLEQAIIDTLDTYGVDAGRNDGFPGVWTGLSTGSPRKIASLGLRVKQWVTFHGIALNVDVDLAPFTWFTPCGIPDVEMTSMARELDDTSVQVSDVAERLTAAIATQFDLDVPAVPSDLQQLLLQADIAAPAGLSTPMTSVGGRA